jgi:outer membrane lipoprotein SlyB
LSKDSTVAIKSLSRCVLLSLGVGLVASLGCASPYAADRGALIGGGTGAAVGAIVGNAVSDNPLAGAAIGGIAGAITGGAVGSAIDDAEARNRALIESQLNRPVGPGAVSTVQIVELSQAGVNDELIVNHIRANGVAQVPTASDLIALQQAGVSSRVIAAMQEQPAPRPVVVQQAPPPPVIIEHYHRPYYYHNCHPRYYHRHHRHSHAHIGFTFH